uniref:Uncharacterized protein n=1 Tax=Arundo donax TaxID=35708 RepID=A0A0A9BTF7_ARUDO
MVGPFLDPLIVSLRGAWGLRPSPNSRLSWASSSFGGAETMIFLGSPIIIPPTPSVLVQFISDLPPPYLVSWCRYHFYCELLCCCGA